MWVLSKEEMRFYDKHTIEKRGIPSKELMENAGRGCAQFLRNEILEVDGVVRDLGQKIIVFCGNGNNGGDGFVIARYLKQWEYEVEIVFTGRKEKMSPETRENYEECRRLDISIRPIHEEKDWKNAKIDLGNYDILVDAIFGIGFQGEVRGCYKGLFEIINQADLPKIAIDISSGTEADTGKAANAIISDYTLTMAAFKYGHFLGEGKEKAGEVLVIDIGIPEEVFLKYPPVGKLVTADNVKFPLRYKFSHKGNYGKIGIIAGSPGYSGAAVMSARAALRAGAGLVKLFHPAGMEAIFENALIEVMTHSIPLQKNKEIDCSMLFKQLKDLDGLLIGPGIGTSSQTGKMLSFLLENWKKTIILDADALNMISQNESLKKKLKGKLITPHIGEFARLTGEKISQLEADPIETLKEFAGKYDCYVLLKSSTTLFSDGKKIVFNITGNDGLSTGGSGDVLAGIIISFLGQKLDIENAAVSASYLLGATAEKLSETRNPASIIPTDIIEELFKH